MTKYITLFRPQCDWVTLTSYDHPDFHKAVLKWAQWEDVLSSEAKKVTRMQYDGDSIETGSGSVFYGAGIQGGRGHSMLQVSSELADTCYGHFVKLSTLGHCKVTRIDYQVTVPEPEGWSQWGLFNRSKKLGKTVGWAESKTREGTELATVYIGSRQSGRSLRIYQKITEGGEKLLRFEVEFKGEKARSVFNSLSDHTLAQQLKHEIWKTGDEKIRGLFLPTMDGVKPHDAKNRAKAENKTHEWLIKQVLPTFERVVNSDDGGEVGYEFLRTLKNAGKL